MAPLDLEILRREAQELGLHYTGDSPEELEAIITLARSKDKTQRPVPCYGRSYDPTNRRCRICQLRNPCADIDKRPRVEVAQVSGLQSIPCEVCGRGLLEKELVDRDTGEVRDYACTTRGCFNSVAVQCGWDEGTLVSDEIILGDLPSAEEKEEPMKIKVKVKKAKAEPKVEKAKAKAEPKVEKAKAKAEPKVEKAKAEKPKAEKPKAKRGRPPKVADPATLAQRALTPAKKTKLTLVPLPKDPNRALVFSVGGESFESLSAAVNAITGNRSWSPKKFFNVSPAAVKRGVVLAREWKGRRVQVEVL